MGKARVLITAVYEVLLFSPVIFCCVCCVDGRRNCYNCYSFTRCHLQVAQRHHVIFATFVGLQFCILMNIVHKCGLIVFSV